MIVPVILSGGVGVRLWPLSTQKTPKQFLRLTGKESLLQQTLLRIQENEKLELPIIVSSEPHRELLLNQLNEIHAKVENIILEPVAKNTAPAIALAAFDAIEKDANAILLVLPSDHFIRFPEKFHRAVLQAESYAKDYLVTFGVAPDHPETGYGYIRVGDALASDVFKVDSFTEKPDSELAKKYLESGNHYWNSGMFMFSASLFLSELKTHASEIFECCERAYQASQKLDGHIIPDIKAFEACPKLSVDYALMEKTSHTAVVSIDIGWSDLGSWRSLLECLRKENNVMVGDVHIKDVKHSYLSAENKKLVVAGLNNVVVVETAEGTLVLNMDYSDQLKELVE